MSTALAFGRSGAGNILVSQGRPWFQPADFNEKERHVYGAIARLILKHGGSGVVLDPTAWPSGKPTLVRASKVGLIYRKGKPNDCHANAEALACLRGWKQWTGWYRARRDGTWRPHSWLRDSQDRVVETTSPSEYYFGAAS